jgi:hypothetical protein
MTEHGSQLFPRAMGIEEETRPVIYNGLAQYGPVGTHSTAHKPAIITEIQSICPTLPGSNEFYTNGSKIYLDAGGIELATAELMTPELAPTHIAANAELLLTGLANYLRYRTSQDGQARTAILPRRVIDSAHNTWACHDNLSVERPESYATAIMEETTGIGKLWHYYLRSRNFITGAGHIDESGVHFSQKLTVPNLLTKYAYSASLFRYEAKHGPRFEIRCNDINLSDWAITVRLGSAAMVLAASQTPLLAKLTASQPFQLPEEYEFTNDITVESDLHLKSTGSLQRSIDLQRYIHTTILNELEEYTDLAIPQIYRTIGKQVLDYCDDLEKTLSGTTGLRTIASRPDWAEKLRIVIADIEKRPADRTPTDSRSQAVDQLYDRIVLRAVKDGKTTTLQRKNGFGYTQKNSYESPANSVQVAMKSPPDNSRASRRVARALELGATIKSLDWHQITYMSPHGIQVENKLPL